MSLRLLAVGAEFSVGLLLLTWGVASTVRPSLWRWWGARWWVDRTHRTISRAHGLGGGLVGAAIAVSAPAPLLGAPAALGATDARSLEVIGLVIALLGGLLVALSYPVSLELCPEPQDDLPRQQNDTTDLASPDLSPVLAPASPTS